MTRTLYIPLAIAATALALVGAVLLEPSAAAQPTAAQTESQTSLDVEQAPVPAMTGGLCGLTQSDVADIIDYYDLDPDMQGVADALATPFNCSAYGDLCSTLSSSDAHAYACGAWTDMLDHLSVTDVNTRARGRLSQWADPCPPNMNKCEEICDPDSVLDCDGILVGSQCRQLAICDFYISLRIPTFEFLGLEI